MENNYDWMFNEEGDYIADVPLSNNTINEMSNTLLNEITIKQPVTKLINIESENYSDSDNKYSSDTDYSSFFKNLKPLSEADLNKTFEHAFDNDITITTKTPDGTFIKTLQTQTQPKDNIVNKYSKESLADLLINKGTMFGSAIGNDDNNTNISTDISPYVGSDLNKMLLSNMQLSEKLRTQQLQTSQNNANNQLAYLKQRDASMLSLQQQTLAQQQNIANQQLQAQLSQFNKNYSLLRDQYEWQKSYQQTLLNQQQAEYAHQQQVRSNITNQFLGK